MVKDRNELLQVSRQNAQQLKAHLRKSIIAFMRMQGVNADELAYVLGITNDEMAQILDGDGNVTVDVLSKLLVATDNVVEIKPISATPMRGYGHGMPQSGGFPGIPVDENGRPIPPEEFFGHDGLRMPRRPMGVNAPRQQENGGGVLNDGQPRDAHGRFTSRKPAGQRVQRRATQQTAETNQTNPYADVPAPALVNIIRQNLWDGEIDIENATQAQLAQFVFNKENLLRQRTQEATAPVNHRQQESQSHNEDNGAVRGSDSVNQFLEMLGNVAREARNNPALAETIARFMPNNG